MNVDDIKALVRRQAHAWEQGNIDMALRDFSEDAVFISPAGRRQGHDAIRALAYAFFATIEKVGVEVKSVFAVPLDARRGYADAHGAIEWTWRETRAATGARHMAEDAIIFELRGGKIVYWREYYDTAQMERPMEQPQWTESRLDEPLRAR